MLPHTNLGVLSRRGPRPPAGGDRLPGADAGVGLRAADGDGARRLADQAPGAAAGDDRGRRRAPDPLHQRDPRRHRRDGGGAGRLARGDRRRPLPPRPHPGGDPPELRPAPALLRARSGRDRRRSGTTSVGGSGGHRWRREPRHPRTRSGGDAGRLLRGRSDAGRSGSRHCSLPDWATAVTLDEHEAAGLRVPAADARTSASRCRPTSPSGGWSWSRPAPPTSGASRRTATTSLPSSRSPARTSCASRWSPQDTR